MWKSGPNLSELFRMPWNTFHADIHHWKYLLQTHEIMQWTLALLFFFYYFLIIAVFMVLVLNRLCIIVSFAEQLLCFLSQIENGTLNGFYGCTTPKRRRRVEPMHFFVSNTTPHVSNFIFLRDGGREEGRGRRNEVIISYLVNCGPAWGHGRDATG